MTDPLPGGVHCGHHYDRLPPRANPARDGRTISRQTRTVARQPRGRGQAIP